MKAFGLMALIPAVCLALNTSRSFAQNGGQMRLECTGTYHATQIVPGPDVQKIITTFIVDFTKGTVIDAANNVAGTEVHIDATSINFQNATGGVERLSRLDGSWMVSGTDGTISGTCKQVADKNAF